MSWTPATDTQSERYQEACDWFLRLREASEDSELIAEWLRWCHADPANREMFEQVRQSWGSLGAGAALFDRQSADRHPIDQHLRHRWRRPRQLAIAAATLIAVLGAGWLVLFEATGWFRTSEATRFTTGRTEHRSLLLADGSRIEMAGNSQLEVALGKYRRDVLLRQGEAYFSVAHDKTRPFVVYAGDVHVRAVGTRFDVRATTGRVVVAVEEGVVAIEPPNLAVAAVDAVFSRLRILEGKAPAGRTLRPTPVRSGQEFAVGSAELEPQVLSIEPQSVASWRQGRLRFVREPLQSVIDSIQALSGQEIELDDPSLADLRFTGTVFGSGVSAWVNALPAVFPVTVRQDGNRFIISRRGESRR
ncbi:MAG TPA: FecR domain-containing protein [Steroidobacteraceae bacterium]|nr:FecR domain-containing protein [Steroidobacteraceae bacterium]